MLKEIALNIMCQKKYTMLYSTLFWSIYTNSVCSLMYNTEILNLRESKESKYYLGTPMLKQNCSEYNLAEKIIQCPFLHCLGVCTQTQYALPCKIPKF